MFTPEFFTKYIPRWEHEKNHKATPEFVRLLQEVELFSDRTDRINLITHQLKAVISEYLGIPFQPQYAMAVGPEKTTETTVGLFDDFYFNASVRQRCQMAIDNATSSVLQKRYSLEGKQIDLLIEKLTVLLEEVSPHAALHQLTQGLAETAGNHLMSSFLDSGWKETSNLISNEVASQFNLQSNQECLSGPKYFYVMPQSTVHEGWNSMYVIVQPVFIPETGRFLVLHNQHVVKTNKHDWEAHHQFLQHIDPTHQKPKTKKPKDHEQTIMSTMPQLDASFQTASAEHVFLELLGMPEETIQAQQQKHSLFEKIASQLPLHAEYLLQVLSIDRAWEPEWTQAKMERLNQAITNTLATLIHQADGTIQPHAFSQTQMQQWIHNYQSLFSQTEHRQNPWESKQSFLKASISSTPWLKHGVASQIECLVFSFNGMSETLSKNANILSAMKNHSLSRDQLEKLVGKKRAEKWHSGVCVGCGAKDLVGECSICYDCEHNLTNQPKPSLKKTVKPQTKNRPKTEKAQRYSTKHSISPTEALAGAY